MAKQESPVRVNATLLSQVQAAAQAFNRKPPEQLSFWANLGRLVESKLSGAEISSLMSGVADVRVVMHGPEYSPQTSLPVDIVSLAMSHQSEASFAKSSRAIGERAQGPVYESAQGAPGILKRTLPDGRVEFGTFSNGKFRKSRVAADTLTRC